LTPTSRQAANYALSIVAARQLAVSGAGQMIREAAGLSLAEVGAACGVDASTVFRWEEGTRRPSGQRAVDYAAFLERLREAHTRPRRVALHV
jgi:DNA-binding transcriptional regulator YiaG